MKHRPLAILVCLVSATALLAGVAAAEDADLVTSWGVPDLQGTWDFRSITPLERPAEFGDQATLTAEEAAALEQRRREARAARETLGVSEVDPSQGDVDVGYNSFWLDLGEKVSGTMRTSLIVDPPNGRLPKMTENAIRRVNERYALWGQPPSGPEERNSFERCIVGFNAGPPMSPGAYNNMMEIFQSPGYVAIMTEMINDHRVIPTDGREHADESMRFWKGDSSGVWDGDTFVVTTKNYTEHTAFRGTGPNLVLTERFTRTGPDALLYEYTVDDPESFEAPWTSALEMRPKRRSRPRVRLPRRQPSDDPHAPRRPPPRAARHGRRRQGLAGKLVRRPEPSRRGEAGPGGREGGTRSVGSRCSTRGHLPSFGVRPLAVVLSGQQLDDHRQNTPGQALKAVARGPSLEGLARTGAAALERAGSPPRAACA